MNLVIAITAFVPFILLFLIIVWDVWLETKDDSDQ